MHVRPGPGHQDDCWMMPADSPHHGRTDNGTGHQIPVPTKFPAGLKPVADYIAGLGCVCTCFAECRGELASGKAAGRL